ncbi:MAG: acyltransferase [Veillonella sp.]|nr:acyltransferase [Veillonella sp.]
MKKPFLPEITYMRGLCMLGVIAIHVGSLALSNPQANIQVIGFLEILSRFAVPAFFFLSAFGFFYHRSVDESFSYKEFMTKRIQVVFWPYLVWSLFYIIYNGIGAHSLGGLMPGALGPALLFGNAMYHLYFLVILLWFYLMMPLWRGAVRVVLKAPVFWLSCLFILQMGVDFISSYRLGAWMAPYGAAHPALQYLVDMRLNYWVIHYVWIFLLGAVCAEKYEAVQTWLWKYRLILGGAFILSAASMLGAYYYVMDQWHYTLLEAIYTVHQLSPMGVAYTGIGTIFFLFLFAQSPMNDFVRTMWQEIGDKSYGIYLVHPLMLIWLGSAMAHMGWTYTSSHVLLIYVLAVAMSYLATLGLSQVPKGIRKYILGH